VSNIVLKPCSNTVCKKKPNYFGVVNVILAKGGKLLCSFLLFIVSYHFKTALGFSSNFQESDFKFMLSEHRTASQ
jgi:hypothetical protein